MSKNVIETGAAVANTKRPYEVPQLQRVELAIDETLSSGCKLGSDPGCVGPLIAVLDAGS